MVSFLQGIGPAPDQYRILQIFLIGLPYRFLNLYHSIWVFSLVTLTLSNLLILRCGWLAFNRNTKVLLALILSVIYPLAMYTGPRWDTAFIFGLAILLVECRRRCWDYGFWLVLAMLAFARSDIALFYALLIAISNIRPKQKIYTIASIALPLGIQLALQFLIFPTAHYAVDVVMVKENLNSARINMVPLPFFAMAAFALWRDRVGDFCRWLWRSPNGSWIYLLFTLYIVMLFTVAIWSELRLLIHLMPAVILLASQYGNRTEHE